MKMPLIRNRKTSGFSVERIAGANIFALTGGSIDDGNHVLVQTDSEVARQQLQRRDRNRDMRFLAISHEVSALAVDSALQDPWATVGYSASLNQATAVQLACDAVYHGGVNLSRWSGR